MSGSLNTDALGKLMDAASAAGRWQAEQDAPLLPELLPDDAWSSEVAERIGDRVLKAMEESGVPTHYGEAMRIAYFTGYVSRMREIRRWPR